MVIDEVLQAAFDASSSLGCLLCGRETEHVCVFVPDRGLDFFVPPGWRFIYRLCNDHLADWPGVKSRVERHIWKHQMAWLRRKRDMLDRGANKR